MTLRHTKDPQEFAKSFSGRVQSLARVHSILTDSTWQGADLRTVVRDQLLAGVMEEGQLETSGPDVRLPPQAALHTALMLHELATNAAKYGALSVPGGSVSVDWTIDDGMLKLRWMERGGPKVSAPSHRGFGSLLIERTAQSDGGEAHAAYEPSGVVWSIQLPLGTKDEEKAPPSLAQQQVVTVSGRRGMGSPIANGKSKQTLSGRKLLIVEDEPLVAMDSAAQLESAGAIVVGPAGNVNEALRLLDTAELDGTLLDANLNGEPVDSIAAALVQRGIPFLFVSGYGPANLPRSFASAPILGKPFSQDQLINAVVTILGLAE